MSDGRKSIVPLIALGISLFAAAFAGYSALNSHRSAAASERSAAAAEGSLVLQKSLLTTSFTCRYFHGLKATAGTEGSWTPYHRLLFSNNGAAATVATIGIELVSAPLQTATGGAYRTLHITPPCFQDLSLPRRLERNESIEVDFDPDDFQRIARDNADWRITGLVLDTASGERIRFTNSQILDLFKAQAPLEGGTPK